MHYTVIVSQPPNRKEGSKWCAIIARQCQWSQV